LAQGDLGTGIEGKAMPVCNHRLSKGEYIQEGKRKKRKRRKLMQSMALAQALEVDEFVVSALLMKKFGVCSALDNLALIKDIDYVGLLNRA
jgi:hypothetical protein